MITTLQPLNRTTMRVTDRGDLEAAIYGIARLVSGWQDWKLVEDVPDTEKIKRLSDLTMSKLNELQADLTNVDPKLQNSVMRKVRAYQQLLLIESFCFDEVEW